MAITDIAGLPIRKVKDQQLKFNMLIYGQFGSGKTTLAGSADEVPEMSPVLFIDVEGGTLSIRDTNVEAVRVGSWDQFEKILEILRLGKHGYKTVVVDSLTEVQTLAMAYTMKSRKGNDDLALPEIKEWGINIEQTRKFVRAFRDLPVNVIMTTLVRTDVDKRTSLPQRKPMLTGKAADQVGAFFDMVLYLYVEKVEDEDKRILLTDNVPGTIAKDRSNALPKQIVNPTMTDIYNYITKVKDSV